MRRSWPTARRRERGVYRWHLHIVARVSVCIAPWDCMRPATSRGVLTVPPAIERGRLLTAVEVSQIVGRSAGWVKVHVPHKVRLGHRTVRWYEIDVKLWLESQRAA